MAVASNGAISSAKAGNPSGGTSYFVSVTAVSTALAAGESSVIGFFDNRKGRTKAFQPAHHAPMTLVAFDVAAYVLIVCAVFRAHNLFFGDFEIEKVSHGV